MIRAENLGLQVTSRSITKKLEDGIRRFRKDHMNELYDLPNPEGLLCVGGGVKAPVDPR